MVFYYLFIFIYIVKEVNWWKMDNVSGVNSLDEKHIVVTRQEFNVGNIAERQICLSL